MIDTSIIDRYMPETPEEKKILCDNQGVEKNDYTAFNDFIVDSKKLLEKGKLTDVRPHTRFVHFPKHKHNYIEMVYMLNGSTTHIINDNKVILNIGEILLLSKNSVQEILPAGKDDIAINFIILPEFFTSNTKFVFGNDSIISDFIIKCLTSDINFSDYLYFKVSDIIPINNLVENILWLSCNPQPTRRFLIENSLGLLFMQLMNFTDMINNISEIDSFEKGLVLKSLKYIDDNYKCCFLTDLSKSLNQSVSSMSRLIKKYSGQTFNEHLKRKRLNQAAYYLVNTVYDISYIVDLVGYDNRSYFYRIFHEYYNMTPKEYRELKKSES